MSLIDALLLSPVPTVRWIAHRADGAMGDGTENNPWNGGRANHPTIAVSAVQVTAVGAGPNSYSVRIDTSGPHGFGPSEVVLMKGFSGVDGELYNGFFVITQDGTTPDTRFTYTVKYNSLSQYPTPSLTPSAAGVTCQKDPLLFDRWMKALKDVGQPVRVNLGPGVFETKGYQESFRGSVSWVPWAGLQFCGSGIAVTTLKLVEASYRNLHYHVIGMPPLGVESDVADGFDASEFTLDCAVGNQNTSQITSGAVSIRGSHTRLSRLRVINFGRQGPASRIQSGVLENVSPELFVFAVGGSSWKNNNGKYQSTDCVIEDCIIEQPGLNCVRESTMMIVSGSDVQAGGVMPIPSLATVFRRNYINCEYVAGPAPILSVVAEDLGPVTPGTTNPRMMKVTVTTAVAHGLVGTPWVRVWGVKGNNQSPYAGYDGYANPYNGAYQVTAIPDSDSFEYEAVYTSTATPDPAPPAIVSLVGAWLNRWPSDYVKITHVSEPDQVDSTNVYKVTVTTESPHFLIPRDASGSLTPGCVASLDGIVPTFETSLTTLNVQWIVTQVHSNVQFECERDYETHTPANPTGFGNARVGARWQGFTGARLVEENQVRSCAVAGQYVDSYGLAGTVVRNNQYQSVRFGMFVTLAGQEPINQSTFPAIEFVSTWTTGTAPNQRFFAKFKMQDDYPHFLVPGQGVKIQEARKNGGLLGLYNRSFRVLAVPDPASFEIELDLDPSGENPDNIPTFYWMWVSRDVVFENNLIEIRPGIPGSGGGLQAGVLSLDGAVSDNFWYNQNASPWPRSRRDFHRHLSFTFRNNMVRYALLPSGQPMTGKPEIEYCISNQHVEKGVVTGNSIDIDWRSAATHETPLLQINSKPFYYFNNYSSAGRFVPGTDRSADKRWEGGIRTVVDDAMALALL